MAKPNDNMAKAQDNMAKPKDNMAKTQKNMANLSIKQLFFSTEEQKKGLHYFSQKHFFYY